MFWRTTIILLLGIADLALLGRVIWGSPGFMEYRELKMRYANLQAKIKDLDAQNLAISRDIRLLRSDSEYVEKMIRQKLHYLRDNEMVYIFPKPANSPTGATENDGKN